MKATYEAMIDDGNHESALMQTDHRSANGSVEETTNLIGQYFSDAFSDELQLRGLVPGRTVMRTLSSTEILSEDHRRTRVELDVITEVFGATHNDLIDVLVSAKRKCSAKIGSDVKILLKAELRSGKLDLGLLPSYAPAI